MMKILDFPELRQTYVYDCGASALQSVLVWAGIPIREDEVVRLAGTDKEDGTSLASMRYVLDRFGMLYTAYENMPVENIRKTVDAGHPTIIMLQAYRDPPELAWGDCWDDGHYVVAIGYDEAGIIFEDPSAFTRTRLGDAELCERWHDIDAGERIFHWGCTILSGGKFVPGAIAHMD